jgi:MFS family permease
MAVCACSLSAHWAFMFWSAQHLRQLPEMVDRSPDIKTGIVGTAVVVLMLSSIAGNFIAAAIARRFGYKRTIALMALGYFFMMVFTYGSPRSLQTLWWCFPILGACSGFFALFTMYLPPLFPTLLRTTGAGFSYNIGRIAAAVGTIVFGLLSPIGDNRLALFYSGWLFLPAAIFALAMPEVPNDEPIVPTSSEDLARIAAEEQAILEEVYRERGCSG